MEATKTKMTKVNTSTTHNTTANATMRPMSEAAKAGDANEMRTCIYCGKTKARSEYREYYQGKSAGNPYKYCKECEKIENRRKYLLRMGLDNTDEYAMIIALYDKRLQHGLAAPRSYNSQSVDVSKLVAAQMADLEERAHDYRNVGGH